MAPSITVYTTPTCAPCRVLKNRLDREGVAFDYVDLTEDEAALTALREKVQTRNGPGGSDIVHTPAVVVDGVLRMVGMDAEALRAIVEEAKA